MIHAQSSQKQRGNRCNGILALVNGAARFLLLALDPTLRMSARHLELTLTHSPLPLGNERHWVKLT